ncbi:MAG: cation:proton antiporter regulatory subunit [Acidimicrobiales bacterium]
MSENPASQQPLTAVVDQALPGIGHRYELRAVDGGRVVVVVHHSGRRDLYAFAPGGGEPQTVVTLSDAQARTLGAILGGAYFKPAVVEEIEAVIGGLLIDWITLESHSRGAGATIGELEIRQRTGITVAAILRDHVPLIAPDPTERLQAGDQLVVLGRQEDLVRFQRHVVNPRG